MDRREAGVVLGLVALLAAAGCVGFLTGSEPAAFSANETVVGDAALSETNYRAAGNQTIERSFNVSVAGQERRVAVTSYLHVYNRSVEATELADVSRPSDTASRADNATPGTDAPLAPDGSLATDATTQFAVLATPTASLAGRNVNPLASLSTEDLLERLLAGEDADLTFEGNRTVRSLGADRTVSTYRAGGGDSPATVFHVASFEYDGDVVVVVAGHPDALDERENVDRLVAGLERREG